MVRTVALSTLAPAGAAGACAAATGDDARTAAGSLGWALPGGAGRMPHNRSVSAASGFDAIATHVNAIAARASTRRRMSVSGRERFDQQDEQVARDVRSDLQRG